MSILTVASFALSLSLAADDPAPQDAAADWIRANAVALQGCDPEAELADLDAFGAMVGDARIVALGEPTHGTREVFRMKHRLFRYLVERKGFTLFSLEANLPEAFALNEYVVDGKGDPRQLLDGLYFYTWQTEEILALIEWMRDRNAKNPDAEPVRFTGMDMQIPDVAAQRASEFVQAHAPDLVERAAVLTRAKDLRGKNDAAVFETTIAELDALAAALEDRREALATAASARDAAHAVRNVRIVAWATRMLAAGNGGTNVREEGMADNVAWILAQYPERKIVLWAHNGHVGRAPLFGIRWMGSHLEERLPGEMVVVGAAIGSGVYTAMSRAERKVRTDNPLLAPPEDSVEACFYRAKLPFALVDLRAAAKDEAGRALSDATLAMRSIGGMATDEQFHPCVPREMFDLMVWIESTSASVRL